jgi:predicted dienelactone hydrolase
VTGPYAIGTQTFHLVDESRDEIYTDDPADKREIMMQVWYPAEPDAEGETAVYLENLDVMGPALAERLDLPSFLLNHVNLAKLDVLQDTPVLAADAPYPVLLFSHGLDGIRAQNMVMVRDLVSNGFVVAAIDHTYANALTVFPDGRVVFYDPGVLSGDGEPPHTSNTLVGVWADDIGFVLDELAGWNEERGGAFDGRLDLSRIGVFGHSTGGGAAVEFCGRDERCQAGVGLDAWVVPVSGEIVAAGLAQPFLFLRAAEWEFDDAAQNDAIAESLFASLPGTGYLATVDGAAHFDFTDLPLFSPLTLQLGLSSDMDSDYVVGMMSRMTTTFFRQTLQGADEDLAQEAAAYPEMDLVGKDEG